MHYNSTENNPTTKIHSKHGLYEVFNDKSIKKGFHNLKNHNMKKKYEDKIPLSIIETIAIDKGQFFFWVFTDSQGFVMRKSNKKLNRTFLLDYFLSMIIEYFRIEEGIKFNKTYTQILSDINRFSSQDEKLEEQLIQSDPSYSYLQKFINLQNFHIVYSNEFHRDKLTNLVNIFEFNKIINDGLILNEIQLIQNYLYKNPKYKPLIFKFSKTNSFAKKKIMLMAEAPVNKVVNGDDYESSHDNNEEKEHRRIIINDENLCTQIDSMIEPFIKLIEKSYNISLLEGSFQLLRFCKRSEVDKRQIEYLVYSFCNSIMAFDKSSEEHVRKENEMKSKMILIREKNLPMDLRNKINVSNYERENLLQGSSKIKSMYKTRNQGSSNTFKDYQKISKSCFCFGEFCDYTIPEIFKNLKKNHKLDSLMNRIPIENRISSRDKYNNLPNFLPGYVIKKAFDNPDMVNIVLKAYSIFPKDFDKEKAIKEVEQKRKDDDVKRKEREIREEEEVKRIEDQKKRQQYAVPLPSIINEAGSISKPPSLNMDEKNIFTHGENMGSSTTQPESLEKNNKNKGITLYIPDATKFRRLNYDLMYSKKSLCNNCFVVYMLIDSFLLNIDESSSQFKSLKKAREILLLGDKFKTPYNDDDSFAQEQTENLLFQEEKSDFNLKYILQRNLNKWKLDAMEQNDKRKKSSMKIIKKPNEKKSEFTAALSYNLDVNTKLLKFNLIAERTKNSFFNLIFNELKNKPESINDKLGIKNNVRNFPKSMTTLRMHMGINSLGYNINQKDLDKISYKFSAETTSSKELEKTDNTHTYDKNDSEGLRKNRNYQSDLYQVDIDLFLAYKNLNRKFYSHDSYDKNLLGEEENNENIEDIKNFEALDNPSYSRDQILFPESLNVTKNIMKFDEVVKDSDPDKIFQKKTENKFNSSKPIIKLDQSLVKMPPILRKVKTAIIRFNENINEKENDMKKTSNIYDEQNPNNKTNLLKNQNSSNKIRIKFNLEKKHSEELENDKQIFKRSVTTRSLKTKSKGNGDNLQNTINNSRLNIPNLSINYSQKLALNESNYSTLSYYGKQLVKKKTNPDLFISLMSKRLGSSSVDDENSLVTKEKNQEHLKENLNLNLEKKINNTKETEIKSPNNSKNKSADNNSSLNAYESKKVSVSSIFYNDWNKDLDNYVVNPSYYYHISTPTTKFNEINAVVYENPLDITETMKIEDYIKMGNFVQTGGLLGDDTRIFMHDQFTAVPFKVVEMKSNINKGDNTDINITPFTQRKLSKNHLALHQKSEADFNSNSNLKERTKGGKLIVIVLNDFYDSFTKYENTMKEAWSKQHMEQLNLVFFNFPGQAGTFFPKKSIFNNIYYSEFLDRFIFHLMKEGYLDHTYHLILVGFGNGGHVAMTYASCYEKYWDFLHSLILFNTYSENDDFINKSMLEILKIVNSTKNQKLVNFFVKSVTVNPQKLLDFENNLNFNETDEENKIYTESKIIFTKPSTMDDDSTGINTTGIHNITKGYFYNMKINLKDILTPMVLVHSNQNCFITLNNISSIISNMKINNEVMLNENSLNKESEIRKTFKRRSTINERININNIPNDISSLSYDLKSEFDFTEILPSNEIRRKLIVADGSHDIILENSQMVMNVINSYLSFDKKYVPSPLYGNLN